MTSEAVTSEAMTRARDVFGLMVGRKLVTMNEWLRVSIV